MPSLTRVLRAAASLALGLFALVTATLAQSPAPASFVIPKMFFGIEGFRAPPVLDVATGDLDGDGIPDIVSVGGEGGASYLIGVLLGNGDGTFQPGTYYQIDNGTPQAVALGDFNRDGHLDAAVLLQGSPGSVAIYLGDGTGNLGTPTLYPVGNTGGIAYNNLAAADMNGDRKLDLVVTNDADSTVSVLLGKGDGTFEPQVAYPTGTQAVNQPGANWVAIADVDKDGKPDLVVACDGDNQALSVLLGNGDGTFKAPLLTPGPYPPVNGVAVADLNDDGNPDVVAVSEDKNVAMVFLGNGDGTFQAPAVHFVPGASSVAIANLAGDKKKLDLLVADHTDSTTWVLLGNGDGTFQAGTAYATAPGDQGLAVADFNRDGKLDFVVGAGDADQQGELVTVVLGNGDGTFRASANYGLTYASQILSIAAADFNGDGNLDLAIDSNSQNLNGQCCGGFAVLLGNGHGTFTLSADYFIGSGVSPGAMATADVNGDGNLDLLMPLGQGGGGMAVYLGNGDGTFIEDSPGTSSSVGFLAGTNSEQVLTGDFNDDGAIDAAVVQNGSCCNSYVTMLLNNTPPVGVSPLVMSFAPRTVGSKTASTVLISNNQATPLAIDSESLGGADPGDFTYKSACAATLPPGADCNITVTFEPGATGLRTAVLTITDGVGTQTVSLSGTGK